MDRCPSPRRLRLGCPVARAHLALSARPFSVETRRIMCVLWMRVWEGVLCRREWADRPFGGSSQEILGFSRLLQALFPERSHPTNLGWGGA